MNRPIPVSNIPMVSGQVVPTEAKMPASPGMLRVLTQLPVEAVSTWTVSQVREALAEHEYGSLDLSVLLADSFGRDDRIPSCMQTRKRTIQGLPFELKVNEESANPTKATEVRDQLKKLWPRMFPLQTLGQMAHDCAMLGEGLCQLSWAYEDGLWIPTAKPWELRGAHFDHTIEKFRIMAREGQVVVEPGMGQWLQFRPNGRRSWMGGAVRALGPLFLFKGFCYRDWVRYCERHGIPILAIKEPPNMDVKDRVAFFSKLQKLGTESTIRLPRNELGDSFELEFFEPKDTSWNSFQSFIQKVDNSIAIIILGQAGTTEGTAGFGNDAATLDQTKDDIIQGDVTPIAEAIREQLIIPWGKWNIEGWTDDLAPVPYWNAKTPEDPAKAAEVWVAYANGTTEPLDHGLITFNEARVKMGYPPVEGGDVFIPVLREEGQLPPPPKPGAPPPKAMKTPAFTPRPKPAPAAR